MQARCGVSQQIRVAKNAARAAADADIGKAYEEALENPRCSNGNKGVWRRVNSTYRQRSQNGARALRRADGTTTADPAAILETFAAHNEAVGDSGRFAEGAGFCETHRRAVERGVHRSLAESHNAPPAPALDDPLQSHEIEQAIRQLHNGTAPSPLDEVSAELLKKGAEGMHDMLAALFALQWDTGYGYGCYRCIDLARG